MQNQQQEYSYKKITKIISKKLYRQKQFYQNYKVISSFIKAVNLIQINADSFKIIRILIRYFRFPILILLKPFYDRLQRQKSLLINYIQDQKNTAGIVLKLFDGKQYPSLQFYMKAGCKKDIEVQISSQDSNFRQFINKFDIQLDKIVGDKSIYIIDQLKFKFKQLQEYKNQIDQKGPILKLCIEAYQKLIIQKKKQIEKLSQIRSEPQKKIEIKIIPQKIYLKINGNIKQIIDNKIQQPYLCCRPYFYQNQVIEQAQTLTQQYKNYYYPYAKSMRQILLKTIVGFLNGKGGIIYIGIQQIKDNKKRFVKGQVYNENLKQDVLKQFRRLCQRVSPEIVNNQLYKLQYVPVKNQQSYLPGMYVIRLRISKGQKNQLYSFKNYDDEEYVAFRTANEVLIRRISQQILKLYKTKLNQPEQQQQSNHPGPCKKPELGKQIYDSQSNPSNQNEVKWINKKPSNVYVQKYPTWCGYLFLGKQLNPQLKKYLEPSCKPLVVSQIPRQQLQFFQTLIYTSKQKDQYVFISWKITFQQQYFHKITEIFNQKNILFQTNKSSRTSLMFHLLKEASLGAKYIVEKKIPFEFVQPNK